MSKGKIILIIAILLLLCLMVYIGPEKYLNLAFIKSQLAQLRAYKEANPLLSILIFSGIYIAVTAASIPGALVLTLCSGAIFGFIVGSIIALISASIGATIAFLVARYLFDDWVQAKMGDRVTKIRDNFRKEGALYLFSMRLLPVLPFFAINLLMGLTSIKTTTYFVASLLGMAPGSMVFINAGTQLAKLDSLKGLLSAELIVSLLLLAIFPYVAKYALKYVRKVIKKRRN